MFNLTVFIFVARRTKRIRTASATVDQRRSFTTPRTKDRILATEGESLLLTTTIGLLRATTQEKTAAVATSKAPSTPRTSTLTSTTRSQEEEAAATSRDLTTTTSSSLWAEVHPITVPSTIASVAAPTTPSPSMSSASTETEVKVHTCEVVIRTTCTEEALTLTSLIDLATTLATIVHSEWTR